MCYAGGYLQEHGDAPMRGRGKSMPLVRIETSAEMTDTSRETILRSVSREVAKILGKPDKYMMVVMLRVPILMGEGDSVAAFVDVRSIGGLSPDVNKMLSSRLCGLLRQHLGIPGDRVYLTFADVAAANWGWNNSTFG